MLENIKAVNNPLTIIAIFAALAEIAGTVALATVDKSLQVVFVWFVMLFPTLLVVLFFVTLNFNPKVLYAPSDFKNEENFLNTLRGRSELSLNLRDVDQQSELAKHRIIDEAVQQVGAAGEIERTRITEVVNNQIGLIREKVETARESAAELVLDPLPFSPEMTRQSSIIIMLSGEHRPEGGLSLEALAEKVEEDVGTIQADLEKMSKKNWVRSVQTASGRRYFLSAALLAQWEEDRAKVLARMGYPHN